MNKKNLFSALAALCLLSACTKSIEKTAPPASENKAVSQQNGHLVFNNYETFMSFMAQVTNVNTADRKKWEQSLGFKSFASYLDDYTNQIRIADETKNIGMLEDARRNYKDFIVERNDSSVYFKAPGFIEACMINKDRIVKVGNDYLVYNDKGFTTYTNVDYKQIQALINTTSTTQRVISGTVPSPNHYSVTISDFKVTNSNESSKARIYNRIKLYNLNSTASGNRGFFSVEYFAEHKNWIGTWRTVTSNLDYLYNNLVLTLSDNSSLEIPYGTYPNGAQGFWTPADGWNEKILLISEYLKNNGVNTTHPLFQIINTNAASTPKVFNDDVISSTGGFWKSISTLRAGPFAFEHAHFRINASSIGTGAFAGVRSYFIYEN